MMKANELRIGNWVRKIATSEDTQIFALGIVSHAQCDMANQNWEYQPIPLTPEWLEKFGFEHGPLGSWVKSITIFGNLRELSFSGDYLYLREGKEVFGSGEDDLCVIWNKDVMRQFYVHQLQNLYFALTGEELTVTPLVHTHDGK